MTYGTLIYFFYWNVYIPYLRIKKQLAIESLDYLKTHINSLTHWSVVAQLSSRIGIFTPDTCDCKVEYELLYSTSDPDYKTYTPLQIINQCNIHQDETTVEDLWTELNKDNIKKNRAWRVLLDNALPSMIQTNPDGVIEFKKNIEISWAWSGQKPERTLTITISGITLTQNQKNAAQAKIDERYPNQNIILVNN